MKNLKCVLAICLTVLLFSCSNNDESNSPINGTWNLVSLDHIVTTNGHTSVGVGTSEHTMTFSENPNMMNETGAISIEFNDGSILSNAANGIYNWSINDDQLLLNEAEYNVNYTINTLNENNLIYTYNETREDTEQNGTTSTTVIETKYNFSR